MRTLWLALLVVVVGASSCGLQRHAWMRAGSTQGDAQRDFAVCELEARQVVPDAPRISSPPPQPVPLQGQTTFDGRVGNQPFHGTATQNTIQVLPAQRTWRNDLADQMTADARVRDSRGSYANTCMRAKGYLWAPVEQGQTQRVPMQQRQTQPRGGIDQGGSGGCPYGMYRAETGQCAETH